MNFNFQETTPTPQPSGGADPPARGETSSATGFMCGRSYCTSHLVTQKLWKDSDGHEYTGAEWVDTDGNGNADGPGDQKHPVCYISGSKMKISARWRMLDAMPETIKVRGKVLDTNFRFPSDDGVEAQKANGEFSVTDLNCSAAFEAPKIDFFDKMKIKWEVSFDNGQNWIGAGTSENQVYVTYGAPVQGTQLFHTVVHIGCNKAKGISGPNKDQEIVDAIWSEFADRDVKRADGGSSLSYWKGQNPEGFVPGLVRTRDGNCGAWARFMRETIKSQGISGARVKGIQTTCPQWGKLTIGGQDVPIYGQLVVRDQPAQGGSPSRRIFSNHALVEHNSLFYDPSYGGNPYQSLVEWQNDTIETLLPPHLPLPTPLPPPPSDAQIIFTYEEQ